jgi:NAD(P)-dependent dehydrogenase (short-subunit alcohol dehydrogenase family)
MNEHRGRLQGRRVLVTGSGTGIGREIALEFAREGADVALHYAPADEAHYARADQGAFTARDAIRALGRRAEAFRADFTSVDEVVGLAERAIAFLGGIDALVNNAGITFNRPFLKVTPEQYDTVFHVNMRAQFFLAQRAAADMLTHGGGAICNLTSIHGLQGAPEHAVYAATKGAIIAFTRELGVELAHRNIRVNAIAPGWVMVDSHKGIFVDYTEDGARNAARDTVPVGRPGVPADIAPIAVFLCSDAAQYIVGQTIVADGGTTALMSLISDFRTESTARCGRGYVPGV